MKKRFLDSLPSDWVKYLVVIVLSVLLWVWVFGLYHAPKETEKQPNAIVRTIVTAI